MAARAAMLCYQRAKLVTLGVRPPTRGNAHPLARAFVVSTAAELTGAMASPRSCRPADALLFLCHGVRCLGAMMPA